MNSKQEYFDSKYDTIDAYLEQYANLYSTINFVGADENSVFKQTKKEIKYRGHEIQGEFYMKFDSNKNDWHIIFILRTNVRDMEYEQSGVPDADIEKHIKILDQLIDLYFSSIAPKV